MQPDKMHRGLSLEKSSPPEAEQFWDFARFFVDINTMTERGEQQSRIVEKLYEHCGMPFLPETDIEKEYKRYQSCIARMRKQYETYEQSILVTDILAPALSEPALPATSDPASMIDYMVSAKNPLARFEARRFLHLGALDFEYESYFGNQEELAIMMECLDVLLTAHLNMDFIGAMETYHRDESIEGAPHLSRAVGVRTPLLDGTENERELGENYLVEKIRSISIPGYDSAEKIPVVYHSRVKKEFDGILKSIRKNTPIRTLRDCLGASFFLTKHDVKLLEPLVRFIQNTFIVDESDHDIHPSRVKESKNPRLKNTNKFSAEAFKVEKMTIMWSPGMLLKEAHYDTVNALVEKLYSSPLNRLAFWDRVRAIKGKQIFFEIQIGYLEDLINITHAPTPENHDLYIVNKALGIKSGETSRAAGGGEVNVLEMLTPDALCNIGLSRQNVVDALLAKGLSAKGLHGAALKRQEAKGGSWVE